MVNKVSPSIPPGAFPGEQTVHWTFDPAVVQVAYTVNGLPPALSSYIAYDSLVPPNPFIAVTQDGTGNVVYDGGFPKFYNNAAPDPGVTTFAGLSGSFKYLHNMLKFIANPTKVAAGNKKILFLGDQVSTNPYAVKDTGPNGFLTSIQRICAVAGFVPTVKDINDYGGAALSPNLTELNQYCAVVVFSTMYELSNAPLITAGTITDITTFRQQGNGIALITDHGNNVMSDISVVNTITGVGFYGTANRIATQFGSFFTGNYDRTPVNVGFLRSTYGDHPLYNGMDNSEDIIAGGSESKVIVTPATLIAPGAMPNTTLSSGANTVRFLVKLADGSVETYTFVYNVATGEIIEFKDAQGNNLTSVNIGWDYRAKPVVKLLGAGLGTLSGSIYRNTEKVGECYFDETGGATEIWYSGEPVRVNNGDTIRATIDSPFTYSRTVTVNRIQPDINDPNALANVVGLVSPSTPGIYRVRALEKAMQEAGAFYPMVYSPAHAKNVYQLRNYMEGNIPLADVNVYAYDTNPTVSDALTRLVPPTLQQMFNNWSRFNNDSWYPKGVTPVGDAASWYWDNTLGSAVQPTNTAGYTGFISDYSVLDYDLEVTVQSADADDDWITVVLAYNRDTTLNQNNTLDLLISRGAKGWDSRAVWPNQVIATDFTAHAGWATQTGRYKEVGIVDGVNTAGWSNAYKRLKIMRRGDQFTIQATPWNSLVYDPALAMNFTLNDLPDLAKFKGPRPFGFGTLSQAGATFKNLVFSDGYRRDVILDMLNNRVYRYFNGAWLQAPGVTVHDIFGAPRIINAIEGNKRYQLNANGTITLL